MKTVQTLSILMLLSYCLVGVTQAAQKLTEAEQQRRVQMREGAMKAPVAPEESWSEYLDAKADAVAQRVGAVAQKVAKAPQAAFGTLYYYSKLNNAGKRAYDQVLRETGDYDRAIEAGYYTDARARLYPGQD